MRIIDLKLFILALSLVGLSISLQAKEHVEHKSPQPSGVAELSAEVRQLLKSEMQAIDAAMQKIVSASAKADWHTVESLGHKIEQSFILKQRLTPAQVHELHAKLPLDFLKQDQAFHYFAGMLAHAAKMQKAELVNFYFAKMNQACMSCHAEHAADKFPGFATEAMHQENHEAASNDQRQEKNDHHH